MTSLFQRLERGWIAEKGRHGYEKVAEKGLNFTGILTEQFKIILKLGDLFHLHAARQPSQDRRALIFGEVVTGPRPQMGKNGAKQILAGIAELAFIIVVLGLDDRAKPLRESAKRQHFVRASGGDGAARHGRILGFVRVLDENQTARLPDRFHPYRAVRPGAGQYDGEDVAMAICERPEEEVDGRALSALLLEFARIQRTVRDR